MPLTPLGHASQIAWTSRPLAVLPLCSDAMPLSQPSSEFIRQSLPGVSRTFALGISLLRDPLRDAVGLGYLLCRVLDTLEDAAEWPIADRIRLLERAASSLGSGVDLDGLGSAISSLAKAHPFDRADSALCVNAPLVFQALRELPQEWASAIYRPAAAMARGMAETLAIGGEETPVELSTEAELDQYCYFVAGTVGEMLTNLFQLDRQDWSSATLTGLRRQSVDFGLGLQMVNVIKDVTDDFARGVVYLPRSLLGIAGADLNQLLADPTGDAAQLVVGRVAGRALGCLDAAMAYTLTIPERERDVRLFCALPLLLALRTLARAATDLNSFASNSAPKVSRVEVTQLHQEAEQAVAEDAQLGALIRRERAATVAALARLLPHGGDGVLPRIAYIGLGSNLGDRHCQLDRALELLAAQPGVRVLRESRRLETAPVDCPPESGLFVNSAAELSLASSAAEAVSMLLSTERELGRDRTAERNEPRLIDLDLLMLNPVVQGWQNGEASSDECEIVVPHPRLHLRPFVLVPLAELAPELQHPVFGKSIQELNGSIQVKA